MIEATIVDNINIANKEFNFKKVKSSEYAKFKEIFTIEAINIAIDELNLKYKSLNECDVYNIIEYILQKGRSVWLILKTTQLKS